MKKYAKILIALAMALILAVEIVPGVIRGAKAADDAAGFVALCYQQLLGRAVDATGMAEWTEDLESGQAGGAQVIIGILGSGEYQGKRYPYEATIRQLYQLMLGREPDAAGLKNWIAVLESGRPMSVMVLGIAKTDVFKNKCDHYGILTGIVTPEKKKKDRGYDIIDPRTNRKYILEFVTRCYKAFLAREPETEGLEEWTKRLMSGRVSGAQTVKGFTDTFEFIKRNLSHEQIVEAMYRGMLGRGSDPTGKAEWVAMLDGGAPIEQLINGFAGSPEFVEMCKQCGIKSGSVPLPGKSSGGGSGGSGGEPATKPDPDKIAKYVDRCYRGLLGRKAGTAEIDEWTMKYCTGLTGTLGIISMVNSREFVVRKLKNKQIVEVLYRAMLGRRSDETGMNAFSQMLNDGYSVEKVINQIGGSQEYLAICRDMGIQSGIIGEKPQVTRAPVTENPSKYKNAEKNKAFVEHCYLTILRRGGDSASIKKYVDSITKGERTPEQVIMSFLTSVEFRDKVKGLSNEEAIKMLYRAYLYREASEAEIAEWMKFFPGPMDVEKAAVTFEKSREFNAILDGLKE